MRRIKEVTKQRNRQTGGLTIFTAIMVLIILTLMIFYAARVGLFEQRVSANEVRQKTAFHAAEAVLDQGVQYLLANAQLVLSSSTDAFADGAGGTTRDGWFASNTWVACDGTNTLLADHPCGGETPMKVGSFYYDDPDTNTGVDSLPIGVTGFPEGVTARLSANICFVTLTTPDAATCEASPLTAEAAAESFMIITLLSYGFSDCTDITDISTCQGEATVAKPLANYKNLAGAPTVPLVTKSTFPPTGTAVVVPNPNGGGVGVPISAWINDNGSGHECENPEADVLSSGSWNTCEMEEWYGQNHLPEGIACTQPNCSCTEAESISYKKTGTTTVIGIDIVPDTDFPCNLLETFFGPTAVDYTNIKRDATKLDGCSLLTDGISGFFWISGSDCRLNNVTLGSPESPIILISAALTTTIVGNVDIFGVLYIYDGEEPLADVFGAGTASIYGALIVDAKIDKFAGTFNIVYSEGVLLAAAGLNGMGGVNGGWRDFGLPELAW